LETASTRDEDAAVRDAASVARLDDAGRLERARNTFFDATLPAQERVGALFRAFGNIGPGLPVDPDVADELFAIAVDPSDPEAGGAAWTLLVYAGELDPKLVEPLLSIVNGQSQMRGAAVTVLGHFKDQPAVGEALERALDDPDRNVRNNAQRALECAYCSPAAR
jgi:HEAT repeat protein